MFWRFKPSVLLVAAVLCCWTGFVRPVPALAGAPVLAASVVARFPHDPAAFTQGLLFHDGVFYESTGLYGQSSLRRVDPATGRVLASRKLPTTLFAEGLALTGGRLYQLTWREGKVLLADPVTLRRQGELPLGTEGWGACAFDGAVVVSDGSDTLTFYDPRDWRVRRRITVSDDGAPVDLLNELETVGGLIWANVWRQPRIAVIDPASGRVVAWVDCTAFARNQTAASLDNVLNGIAFDPATGRIWVTGKCWPVLYEIKVPGLVPGMSR